MDKSQLLQHVRVLYHSCSRLDGEKIIYTDPYDLDATLHDADIILITHSHYDHFSPEDIDKVKNSQPILVAPKAMCELALKAGFAATQIVLVEPDKTYTIAGIKIETVPAYNVGKDFHPQKEHWVGYVVEMNSLRYFIAGDTDINADNQAVHCDVALLPVGGVYTMDASQAAQLAHIIKPQAAVPTHYGAICGKITDGKEFCRLLSQTIVSATLLERFATEN